LLVYISHVLCHNPGFDETCPFCERHQELHIAIQASVNPEQPNPPSAELLYPEPAIAGKPGLSPFTAAVVILAPAIFFLYFFLHGVGILDLESRPTGGVDSVLISEMSTPNQVLAHVNLAYLSLVLAIVSVSVVSLIGMLRYIIFWPLALLSAFVLKPLKPILLPVSYPFIELFTIIKYTLSGTTKFVLRSFFTATVKRKCDKEHNVGAYHDDCVCFIPPIAVISLVTLLLLALSLIAVSDVLELNDFIIFFSAHPVLSWGIVAYYATNILSLLYELGRRSSYKSYNKRVESGAV